MSFAASVINLKNQGFSLIELLITLSIIVIFLLLTFPDFSQLYQHNQTTTIVNQLLTAINFARSQAITQNKIITLCGSADAAHCDGQWQKGQVISIDDSAQMLRTYPALPLGDRLVWRSNLGKNNYLKLAPTGFTDGQNGSFYYCPKYPKIQDGAIIVVALSGRARVEYDVAQLQQGCDNE